MLEQFAIVENCSKRLIERDRKSKKVCYRRVELRKEREREKESERSSFLSSSSSSQDSKEEEHAKFFLF